MRVFADGMCGSGGTYMQISLLTPECKMIWKTLESLFLDRWRFHIAPDLHLHTIGKLGEQLKKIETQLDDAVAAARPDGISWDKSAGHSESLVKACRSAGI